MDNETDIVLKLQRYQKALEYIKNKEGKVCSQFMTCTHRACNSSYSAWAVADGTLSGMPLEEIIGVRKIDEDRKDS